MQQIEVAAREKAAQERVEQVATLLAGADRPRGLAAYAELNEARRREVRARNASPTLGFLDAILAALPGGRSKAAVEAALALERAAALADHDAMAAAALLAPHERALERVPLADVIADKARAAAAEERHRRAIAALKEAEDGLDAGHFARARELLERLDVRAAALELAARSSGDGRERWAAEAAAITEHVRRRAALAWMEADQGVPCAPGWCKA